MYFTPFFAKVHKINSQSQKISIDRYWVICKHECMNIYQGKWEGSSCCLGWAATECWGMTPLCYILAPPAPAQTPGHPWPGPGVQISGPRQSETAARRNWAVRKINNTEAKMIKAWSEEERWHLVGNRDSNYKSSIAWAITTDSLNCTQPSW